MRQVVSISLPATEVKKVQSVIKKRGYASLSAYIQSLLKADQEIISETQLLASVRKARSDYRSGKSIQAKSIADLV